MSVIFACDLGGTSFRAALIDERGGIVARHRIPSAVSATRPGWFEIDPVVWWRLLQDCAEALRAAAPETFGAVAAVAISAFTRSQVLVDSHGEVLRPAILWQDARAESVLPELRSLLPVAHPETPGVSAFHPLARLHWLRREEPEICHATRHVLEPKDYLNLRLTGRAAGDPISMARLAASAMPHGAIPSLFDAAGFNQALLPPSQPPVSIVGEVRRGLEGALGRLAGLPVVAMANDTWASVVGLGALREGYGYNLSGTTEVLGIVGRDRIAAEGLLSVDWSGDASGLCWQLGGPSLCGGDTLAWLLGLFGSTDTGAALDALLAGSRDADPVLFLPFLQGERVPYWDPSLRGAFIGLNRRHGPTDLAWAVLEGIAFLNRMVLERAETAAGAPVREIRFGGGGAANALWRQAKADILNRSIVVVPGEEHGLLGAAIAAWTAIGRFPDLDSAQDALVRPGESASPRQHERDHYDRLYALFAEAAAALNPISRRLASSS